ncbi:MAG: HAD-IIIA family hydrolase [Rhodospirillaceae bacterium]|nr:HAD-IIIA family hydrolase [Rhodospirillaceae bacterium]MBL6942265.1 HAD-IIIA family hydrolase [Rhodospirillales bacterium]
MNDKMILPEGATFVDGVFHQNLRPEKTSKPRPALFLDRDGCVVLEAHYLHKVKDVDVIVGAADVIARANALEIAVVFVTNQAGVGYGYFGWPDFFQVQNEILGQLAKQGAQVDGVYACPFHEKGKPPYDHPDHPARKPNPGMLMSAAEELNLDLGRSWIIGDRAGDLEAGLNAGLAGGVHVATGHGRREGEREAALALNAKNFQALAANSIADIKQLIGLFS